MFTENFLLDRASPLVSVPTIAMMIVVSGPASRDQLEDAASKTLSTKSDPRGSPKDPPRQRSHFRKMSYRFKAFESVSQAVERIALERLDQALDHTKAKIKLDEAVHDIRVCFKKIRGPDSAGARRTGRQALPA
jgi:hypothetical protein